MGDPRLDLAARLEAGCRRGVEWTAREAFAAAYCWSEFVTPQDRHDTPESYWMRISERARNECRKVARDRLLLAVSRGDAVAVLPSAGLREGEFAALKDALGMKADHRVRRILNSVRSVFLRSAKPARALAASAPLTAKEE